EGVRIDSPENQEFVRQFLANLPTAERGNFLAKQGGLSKDGVNRIRNAMLAKAYGDFSLLERMTEDTDSDIRNVDNALWMVAPQAAKFRAGAQSGAYWPSLDITQD